ncbi:hypothetical protein EYF80_007285 [Liparis tanakae]|uniref:Uncharacterized protein n=1 Tax=Liparis tanakae TaxID=230148 RepID=A0A4Z2IWV3_9TELE|nr:hypothetical protein EYF80_007285 [Liparis tanakae]
MKGGHHHHRHHRGCGCQHLFRKVLVKCGCCYARVRGVFSRQACAGLSSFEAEQGRAAEEVRHTAKKTCSAERRRVVRVG